MSLHISTLEEGYEAIERGACTVLNLAWVWYGPTYVRRMFALAEAAGLKTLLSTDQDSTIGTAGAVHLGVSVPNLDIPADPAGPPALYSFACQRAHPSRGEPPVSARGTWLGRRIGR